MCGQVNTESFNTIVAYPIIGVPFKVVVIFRKIASFHKNFILNITTRS